MKRRMILAVAMVPLFASAQNPAPTPKPTPWTPNGSALDKGRPQGQGAFSNNNTSLGAKIRTKVAIAGKVIIRTKEGIMIDSNPGELTQDAKDIVRTKTIGGKHAKGWTWLVGFDTFEGAFFKGHGYASGTYSLYGSLYDRFEFADGSAK